ncbi:hypothetical protein WMY93_015066 [Mugilogobius chulae]|uniref:AIG1-type G domain-containing protein n=1 Tax=Mugilogobius chulae TaxID=88201 RepID=A0AAW0NWR6_9GOBI
MISGEETRIILLGKTGAGKSSLANTILGEKIFQAKSSPNSETSKCTSSKKYIDGKMIHLIDTPGVFDTDPNSTDLGEKLYNCVKDCADGPHAFLFVLKVEKYTQQEQDVVRKTLKYFSAEALKYTTVVFTHGDQLDGQTIEEWYSQNESLSSLVRKCGGRCHVIDNRYWNNTQDTYRNNQIHAAKLLKTIHETVAKNGGKCYTNGFWQYIKHERILGVPLKYILAALLGAAAGGAAFGVAKCLVGATTAKAIAAGGVTSAAVGAGTAYTLAPDEVGGAALNAASKAGGAASNAASNMTKMASSAAKSVSSCMGKKPKRS